MNSGAVLVATTEFGGKGSYLVQTPANLAVVAVVSSADTVTALQTKRLDGRCRSQEYRAIRRSPSISNESKTFLDLLDLGRFSRRVARSRSRAGESCSRGARPIRSATSSTGRVPSPVSAGSHRRCAPPRSTASRALTVSSGASGIYRDVLVQSEAALEIVGFTRPAGSGDDRPGARLDDRDGGPQHGRIGRNAPSRPDRLDVGRGSRRHRVSRSKIPSSSREADGRSAAARPRSSRSSCARRVRLPPACTSSPGPCSRRRATADERSMRSDTPRRAPTAFPSSFVPTRATSPGASRRHG